MPQRNNNNSHDVDDGAVPWTPFAVPRPNLEMAGRYDDDIDEDDDDERSERDDNNNPSEPSDRGQFVDSTSNNHNRMQRPPSSSSAILKPSASSLRPSTSGAQRTVNPIPASPVRPSSSGGVIPAPGRSTANAAVASSLVKTRPTAGPITTLRPSGGALVSPAFPASSDASPPPPPGYRAPPFQVSGATLKPAPLDTTPKAVGPADPTKEKEAPPLLTVGSVLRKHYEITARLGAGAFGETFEARDIRPKSKEAAAAAANTAAGTSTSSENDPYEEPQGMVCIKVEKPERASVLKTEIAALKKAQVCPHVVRYLASGVTEHQPEGYQYVVMSRMRESLADCRRRYPRGAMDLYTAFMIGISALNALEEIHKIGLVHRDVKPSNFVLGYGEDRATCFLIDFGLARRFRGSDGAIRPPRRCAGFRGTQRYASLNAHRLKELGPVDDLWSFLFMLVEMITGELPWRRLKDREQIAAIKESEGGDQLVRLLPRELGEFVRHLKSLCFEDEPSYGKLKDLLRTTIVRKQLEPPKDSTLFPSPASAAAAAAGASDTNNNITCNLGTGTTTTTTGGALTNAGLINVNGIALGQGVAGGIIGAKTVVKGGFVSIHDPSQMQRQESLHGADSGFDRDSRDRGSFVRAQGIAAMGTSTDGFAVVSPTGPHHHGAAGGGGGSTGGGGALLLDLHSRGTSPAKQEAFSPPGPHSIIRPPAPPLPPLDSIVFHGAGSQAQNNLGKAEPELAALNQQRPLGMHEHGEQEPEDQGGVSMLEARASAVQLEEANNSQTNMIPICVGGGSGGVGGGNSALAMDDDVHMVSIQPTIDDTHKPTRGVSVVTASVAPAPAPAAPNAAAQSPTVGANENSTGGKKQPTPKAAAANAGASRADPPTPTAAAAVTTAAPAKATNDAAATPATSTTAAKAAKGEKGEKGKKTAENSKDDKEKGKTSCGSCCTVQ